MTHTIDAKGKAIGRVASEAAIILMGKNETDFAKNVVSKNKVIIINASKAKISAKKLTEVEYERYSGYPGGLTKQKMGDVIYKKGYGELFKMAVNGMLPKNKLQSLMMKNLTITE
ncbi:MAG: 50S ribosomal protein L13 [Candidatus Paceibacterota bacterium]|jgi:large subunit ribosomal protein L13